MTYQWLLFASGNHGKLNYRTGSFFVLFSEMWHGRGNDPLSWLFLDAQSKLKNRLVEIIESNFVTSPLSFRHFCDSRLTSAHLKLRNESILKSCSIDFEKQFLLLVIVCDEYSIFSDVRYSHRLTDSLKSSKILWNRYNKLLSLARFKSFCNENTVEILHLLFPKKSEATSSIKVKAVTDPTWGLWTFFLGKKET